MKKIICFVIGAMLTISLFGCQVKPAPNTAETLEVYALDVGYGVKWCTDMLADFKEQDWVKEKYPNLEIAFSSNDNATFAESKVDGGAKNNTIDLLFGTMGIQYSGKDASGAEKLANLTEVVYNQKVPGEDVLYIDKCLDSFNKSNAYVPLETPNADPSYYFTPWAGGMDGFVYNADILNSLGKNVPNTTKELEDICKYAMSIKGNSNVYPHGYSFIQSKEAIYWSYLFPIFWAQYEGIEEYYNFYSGISGNRISKDIFNQMGRVRSLEVYETLLDYSKGYLNKASFTYDFMTAQTMFLRGNGLFHVNGDWFDNEMAGMKEKIKKEEGIDYSIKMMKTPIVSSIIERTPSIKDDAMLSAVVAAVDAGKTSYANVTETDFKIIKDARNIVNSLGPSHRACVPSYAVGKDVAIDFLRYMATDRANDIYIKATNGASLPFDYNVIAKNPELYNSLSDLQRDRLGYFCSDIYNIECLPSDNSFPLVRYGGLSAFNNDNFYGIFSADGNKITPLDLYNDAIDSWTDAKWQHALALSGINE